MYWDLALIHPFWVRMRLPYLLSSALCWCKACLNTAGRVSVWFPSVSDVHVPRERSLALGLANCRAPQDLLPLCNITFSIANWQLAFGTQVDHVRLVASD